MSVDLNDVKIKNEPFDRDAYIQSLPPGVRKDALHGGKTQSPLGNLGILGATFAAVKAPVMALTIAGAPTNAQELSRDLVGLKSNPLNIGTLTKKYRIKALNRAYKLGKKIPVVSDVIDETEGIIPRLRGLKQLVTQGTVTDVGPGMKTAVQKSKRPGALGKGNTKVQQRLKNLLIETDDAEQLKQLGIKSADDLEIGIKKGEGIVKRTPTSALIKEQLKDLDPKLAKRDVAKRYADQPIFIKKLDQLNTKVQQWYDGPGKGRLAGFPKEGRTITAPDGIKYRIRDSNKAGGTGKFSINQDISARNTAQIRKIAQGPDIKTLAEQFKKHVPKNQVSSAVESYTKTNKKVYNALTAARKRYNVGKPKADHATIEHIFDVDFHKRLKDEAVKGFSGQGADELWNLKMIDYALNSKTGALNKKAKDMGQVLIDAVRKDEFIDYNQVVKDFVDNDLGSKIAKLKPKDWDIITEYSMKNPKLNMQQILINYTKGK